MMLKIIRCVEPVGSIVDQDNFLSDYVAYYIDSIAHFRVSEMNGKFLCICISLFSIILKYFWRNKRVNNFRYLFDYS